MAIGRTNCGTGSGGGGKKTPTFSYTGTYALVDDADAVITQGVISTNGWKLKFLTSGIVNFTDLGSASREIDIFCVGGGGGGGRSSQSNWGTGGGGGYTTTTHSVAINAGVDYTIEIGSGGAAAAAAGLAGSDGGNTSAFNCIALGGKKGNSAPSAGTRGGDGGSGAGSFNEAGGSDGSNGLGAYGGTGQGTTTREFGEQAKPPYSYGGSSASGGIAPHVEKGSGGNNGNNANGTGLTAGEAGIVIIRNHRG